MQRFGRLLLLAILVGGLLAARSGVAAQEPAPAPSGESTDRGVKRTVLPDGTIQFESADGTIRRVRSNPSPPSDQADKPDASDTAAGRESDLMVQPPPAWLKDPATNKAFLDAMGQYYAYRSSGLQHRAAVFEWQLSSSKIIFGTVLLLVFSGITFAAMQFYAGLKRKTADARDAATEIDLSTTSVKVTSPVLGVIILVISLAFFYLYLVYVYPISELV